MKPFMQSLPRVPAPVLAHPGFGTSLPQVLMITSYPPRECGIATYSSDLKKAIQNKFKQSFSINICPVESNSNTYLYDEPILYTLNTDEPNSFLKLAHKINSNASIEVVVVQHEFGFYHHCTQQFQQLLDNISKPVVIAFHTILPKPHANLKKQVQQICSAAANIIVMTKSSANILEEEYGIQRKIISVIPHGTHLVSHPSKNLLKKKYQLSGKKILSTFGLLGSGKNIETTLDALPDIVAQHPNILFLIIGKTHPSVVHHEGEQYRNMLEEKVKTLHLEQHVTFINSFLPTATLLEYLQMTDIYLFTSRDRNQAVSGTFSYAISCGCPVISTPIPHAMEVLKNENGIIIDFESPIQLSREVNALLHDDKRRTNISLNGLHRMAPTAWENAAISHAQLFESLNNDRITLQYKIPDINLDHIKKLTTKKGIIQFSKINQPDIDSGYTLDDNARALVAMCQHYEQFAEEVDLDYIDTYFNFIQYCQQPDGSFLNYVHANGSFTVQNDSTNLEDSNGRAFWALGFLISLHRILSPDLISEATKVMNKALPVIRSNHSSRAMAFVIKGLYYRNLHHSTRDSNDEAIITELANRLVQMYRHEAGNEWKWFESYLTYANSTLPEAMLCAFLTTHNPVYKTIAIESFHFLLSKTFDENDIHVISNKSWMQKGVIPISPVGIGEQPIDVAYTIMALSKFYQAFHNEDYLHKMQQAFNWFLGQNHLHQIIYNPCTGGCYDGLEDDYINLNQGAESTISYLMARLTISLKHTSIQSNQLLIPIESESLMQAAFAAPVNNATFQEII
jgi:glycosyltransferase involved in cell wall biosynthesis